VGRKQGIEAHPTEYCFPFFLFIILSFPFFKFQFSNSNLNSNFSEFRFQNYMHHIKLQYECKDPYVHISYFIHASKHIN
jgi:hypothetical protein